ncbi:FAD-binding oxidoreductase [Labrys monachus]|uniref:FAD/FMN-containing dehydrogenase n=1 Tax=Labrys monachus TaxID=217067 RepID=A0ABU0FGC5_9HYPH|nr:FAD-binding oxidoreductase [Labrys monachus]MDQ0393654.1 FAD/FMN-containing dehydrogenase [Labrys monachus]
MASSNIVEQLRQALGPSAVLAGDDIPDRNLQDWSTLGPVRPQVVIRPSDPQGVATAMRIAAQHGIAVVPQGGLTGLAGGSRPIEGGMALSLERLVGIEEIDPAAATMTVRAGTTLEAIQRAADDAGFLFALDLGARGSCAIGGNIGTNAGGNRVIRYGMMRDMVLGLEVVLPDGTLVDGLNKMIKNNAGYDLKQLFIGSEGTLGVVTRAVLKLFPKPACTMAALCGLGSYEAVLELLASARRWLGPTLSAFEAMWPDYWEVATRRVPNIRRPIAGDHEFYILVEAQGSHADDARRFDSWLESQAEAGTIEDAAVAQSLADVKAFWGSRDAAADFKLVLGPHSSFDIGLPVAGMDAYARACRALLAAEIPGCTSYFYGHIGDGNMHIIACVPGADAQPYDAIDDVVYQLVRRHGGTISAEHGIGLKKKKFLAYTRTPEELALMRVIKNALDPQGILNPGKVL